MSKMAGIKTVSFSPGVLESKLRDLSSTMQSIQELSQWLIHHKKHARSIVGIWFREMQKGEDLLPGLPWYLLYLLLFLLYFL